MFTDSHCHITDDSLYEKIEEVIQNIIDKKVTSCMIMCTGKKELERALEIKKEYPFFKVAFGWFPEDAKTITEQDYIYLEDVIKQGKIDCLGEIGLDYYWDTSFNDLQKEMFIRQIQIANAYNLPISIHMRESTKDCMDILKQYAKTKIIFHCFSGSKETMMEALKMNAYISFAGPITFKNARQAPECIQACPVDRILSETDSPYLTPVPYRGKQNQPMYVEYVAKKISELKNIDLDSLCAQISKNYQSFFER
ncbi:MAG: TatD family hydrolase [Holdemanella sp.]|nr:TatD family hydrolase [Holdemanella sp.]